MFVKKYPTHLHDSASWQETLVVDFLKRNLRSGNTIRSFDEIIRSDSESYAFRIADLIGKLNQRNYSLRWWAYIFTAKNPLSSPLFNELVDIVAILEETGTKEYTSIYFINVRPSQKKIISDFYSLRENAIQKARGYIGVALKKIYAFCRAAYLTIEVYASHAKLRERKNSARYDIGLLTYLDGSNRKEKDPYFGTLYKKLEDHFHQSVLYIFYIYRPLKSRNVEIEAEQNEYSMLFKYLQPKDILWVLFSVIKEFFAKRYPGTEIEVSGKSIPLFPLFAEHMISELGKGYTDNLLVFRAARNIASKRVFNIIIYPFENKSIEKCLLLGLNGHIKTKGYQHSSITPRHYTYHLSKEEFAITPVADTIITLGKVTGQWLISRANFDADKIRFGFSLRHNLECRFSKNEFEFSNAKLLFAFSSGLDEIAKTIQFLKPVVMQTSGVVYRFRTHINFPLSSLGEYEKPWIDKNINKVPGNTLMQDMEWADIVVYISSTVALEAMFCGIPVVRLDIDTFNSDPLLIEQLPYRWNCSRQEDFVMILKEIAETPVSKKEKMKKEALDYINSYMKRGIIDDYKLFLN